jgi:spore coat polysaccharide biosynthesis predicted glycosyltransferase SpsG
MSGAIVLVAEADGQIGFGHLAELRAIAHSLKQRTIPVVTIAVGQNPASEKTIEWLSDYQALAARLRIHAPQAIVWSVRTDGWRRIWRSVASPSRHVWIADVARDYPAVDVLVVPTLDPHWSQPESRTRVLAGPEYFPLDVRGPRDVPPVSSRSRDVLLTLGGADRSQASLQIIPALEGTRSTVVIGPAFRHREEVEAASAAAGIDFVFAPDGLRALLLEHRIVISAGGNTLFEAAASGTPALVAWEDPHEEAQGRSFERRGAARVIGRGASIKSEDMRREVIEIIESSDLEMMSEAGRRLVDGRGADRIADLLVELAHGAAA